MSRVIVVGPRDKIEQADRANGLVVNTTSRSKNWSRGLSPFVLGPCKLYGGYVSQNMENAWQYSKVYSQFVDKDDNITEHYFVWARNGWKQGYANRYPMGKGAVPKFSYWDGKRMDYVDARKKIYVPLYYRAVKDTGAYKILRDMYLSNDVIYLWDFDGYRNDLLGMNLVDVLNCPDRKMGHAFVLARMLEKRI
jgi:hypothetical protein